MVVVVVGGGGQGIFTSVKQFGTFGTRAANPFSYESLCILTHSLMNLCVS